MSLSLDLYARICAAHAMTNEIDHELWPVDPPEGKGVVVSERGIASLPLQHLFQLFLELEEEAGDFEEYDEVTQSPYQSAICVVCELMSLIVVDMLEYPFDQNWMITNDYKLFEYRDADIAKKGSRNGKEWPNYLRPVP